MYKLKYDILSLLKKNDFEIFNVSLNNHIYEKLINNFLLILKKQYPSKIYIENFFEQKKYLVQFLCKFKLQYRIKKINFSQLTF